MKRIGSIFLTGLVTLLPIVISLYIIIWIFTAIDSILGPSIVQITGHSLPGVGFVLTIILILLIGMLTTNCIGKKLLSWSEVLFSRTPLLGKIYLTIKRIIGSLLSQDKNAFKKAVLVEFPREGLYSMGFITNDNFSYIDEENYCLFIPTTPNPTSGYFIVAPRDKVRLLDIPVEQAMEILISAGTVTNA
ncbi:MAG: DUF502 domain-containing protein [Bacillota bacterium]|nr:DUF502 domain-containing protein [Bacillota bacterium]